MVLEQSPTKRAGQGLKKILVASDNRYLQTIINRILHRKDFKLIPTTTKRAQLAGVDNSLDMVILELVNPLAGSAYLIKQISSLQPALPIVVICETLSGANESVLYELGAAKAMYKPLFHSQLQSGVFDLIAA